MTYSNLFETQKKNRLTLSNVWRSSAILACTCGDVAWLIKDKISSMEFCIRNKSINWSIHSIFVASRLSSENRLYRRSLSALAKENKKKHNHIKDLRRTIIGKTSNDKTCICQLVVYVYVFLDLRQITN